MNCDPQYSVSIRGVTYRGVKEAAEALGMSCSAVYSGIHRGTPDTIGLGRGRTPPKTVKRPITLGGVTFESLAEASRALGKSGGYVGHVLRHGGTVAREELMRRAMAFAAQRDAARFKRTSSNQSPTKERQSTGWRRYG